MAVEFTSLGGHRLPVRRYEGFSHIPEAIVEEGGVDDALLAETQSVVLARVVSRVEIEAITPGPGAVDLQSAVLVGESVTNVDTSVGPHRLPKRRYEAFDHGIVPTGVRAESQPLTDVQSSVGVQGVLLDEVANFVDVVGSQTVIPDSVVETAAFEDSVEGVFTRVGALVSTVGPMGMPRQRWVDFIHPAGVEEVVSFIDSQDAAIPGETVDFVHEITPAVDIVGAGGTFNEFVEDNVALSDSSTTGSTFNDAANESLLALDSVDAMIEALTAAIVEANTLVDILVVDSIFRNALIDEVAILYDVPGVAGELYDTVAETALATAAFDISGAFTPGVNIDGARTIHVAEEVRELEVMA